LEKIEHLKKHDWAELITTNPLENDENHKIKILITKKDLEKFHNISDAEEAWEHLHDLIIEDACILISGY